MNTRGLALDLDGTLMDSMGFHVQAWQHAFESVGLHINEQWFYELEGVIGPEVIARTLVMFAPDELVFGREDRESIYARKREHFDIIWRPLPMAGVHRLFQLITRLEYRAAVVTGSEQKVASASLLAVGVRDQVYTIVGGDNVTRGKPAPDPYLKAVGALGIPLQHCLGLENAPAGIESAKAAGLICAAVETTLPATYLHHADYLLHDLDAFTDWLTEEHDRSGGSGPWQ